jgi:hypothetical protein
MPQKTDCAGKWLYLKFFIALDNYFILIWLCDAYTLVGEIKIRGVFWELSDGWYCPL